jgi:hypothetical protein
MKNFGADAIGKREKPPEVFTRAKDFAEYVRAISLNSAAMKDDKIKLRCEVRIPIYRDSDRVIFYHDISSNSRGDRTAH